MASNMQRTVSTVDYYLNLIHQRGEKENILPFLFQATVMRFLHGSVIQLSFLASVHVAMEVDRQETNSKPSGICTFQVVLSVNVNPRTAIHCALHEPG